MTKKSSPTPQRPRWQSLVGTGIALLVVLFIYLQTGSVPEGVLEDVLGTGAATVSAILQRTATPLPTDTPVVTDRPTAVPATETPGGWLW